MLGVIDHTTPVAFQVSDAFLDHAEIFFEGRPKNLRDMQVPSLAEDGADLRLRVEQGLELRVVLGPELRAARRSERGDGHVLPVDILGTLEELDVLRVRTRPTALDEIDAEGIEMLGNAQLVIARETEPLHLRAVTQRGVIDFHDGAGAVMAVAAHSR